MARAAYADELQQFELGKSRFDGGEYAQAAERFASMLDLAQAPCEAGPAKGTSACRLTDADIIEKARMYYAASLIALDRLAEADAQFAEILRRNFQFSPDAAAFPQKVLDRFTLVKGQMRKEIEAEQEKKNAEELARRLAAEQAKQAEQRWLDQVLKQAAEERVVVKNSRFVAALPFGIGQFQNGNRSLGWVFAISQAVLASSTIITQQTYSYYASFDQRKANQDERNLLATNQLISIRLNQIAFGAFAVLALGGIVQAQVAFVPERVVVKRRPVPPKPLTTSLSVVPTLSLSPNMVGAGVMGVF